ncbi:DNA-binding transcriptional regulator, AcrR family [Propionibacterium cyclohexanicum]|uniref:DNA-binding transcriptional regulator, AcrR family n=1 Tax=Propionibacterium cyclohexanicum TaxID=64702 RepID=A0A1H9R7Q6_9ACTN|nr:TetR/AcrR family transcriptional regulator [Propionibacterium cyclohexanicum]SER68089.1 DNA-binding transcriptional regulator, AcrR family [Propionibacterium cyclohexanicum]
MARIDRQPRTRLDPDARRAAILAAAAEAFAAHPYAEVTVSSIAQRVGTSDALLYRYFSGKEELYAEIVRLAIDSLLARQGAALASLAPGVPARDRLLAATRVYLDHIASHPSAWAMPLRNPGTEPSAVAAIRLEARHDYVNRLAAILAPSTLARHDYALWGYFGFLDAACLHWVERDCPEDERSALLEAALGALEGALGDWSA